MKVLNVAEKNDAAKNIAYLLSKGSSKIRQGYSKYNKIYEFEYHISGVKCTMIMTSVSGHLLNYDFTSGCRAWTSCNPVYLFEAPVVRYCPKEYNDIKRTLEKEVKSCSKLIIWTDCDKEGENIGFEVIEVCTSVKKTIDIYRAKFSEITQASVNRALNTLGKPNANINVAVNVRRELDLRIGAAFTRFQTLHLKNAFPDALGESLVSYGSCQFPTLGFVVARFKAIAAFIPEKFWKITVLHTKDNLTVEFLWERNRLYHKLACEVLYDICREAGIASVQSVESRPKTKWRPKPLDTIELEKLASRKLHITAKETMRISEKLYTRGLISYPRTETNIFPKEMNLLPLVENFIEDTSWGDFASRVLREGPNPFQGKKSDQAHPPIHPIKYTNELTGDEHKIYDLIVRHFLACLSKHAEGLETIVKIDLAGEKFIGKGLMITARNYLDIYPFDKWSEKEIHLYKEGEQFSPEIRMNDCETCPPSLLTEADLIALMEKYGIGTDATHAEHIETIKARLYVGLSDKYFVPRTLGMGLVEGYDSMGFQMSKPQLRAELEQDLNRICEGAKTGNEVLALHLQKYKDVFQSAQSQVQKLNTSIQKYLNVQPQGNTPAFPESIQLRKVKPCPKCGWDMLLKIKKSDNSSFISCTGFPECREAIFFPSFVRDISVTSDTCSICGPQIFLLQFKFDRGSCFLPSNYIGCIGGCDGCLNAILQTSSEPNYSCDTSAGRNILALNRSNTISTRISLEENQFVGRAASNSQLVNCNCGKQAANLTVKKQGPNLGKKFYSCEDRQCNFFKWFDSNNFPANTGNTTTKTTVVANFSDGNYKHLVNCFCGEPSKRCEVFKEGPNKGRLFHSCSKSFSDHSRCSFFKWDDNEESRSSAISTVKNSFNFLNRNETHKGSGSTIGKNHKFQGNKRKCGLCGQEGHNRKNCSKRS